MPSCYVNPLYKTTNDKYEKVFKQQGFAFNVSCYVNPLYKRTNDKYEKVFKQQGFAFNDNQV